MMNKFFAIVLLVTVGLGGCATSAPAPNGPPKKIRDMSEQELARRAKEIVLERAIVDTEAARVAGLRLCTGGGLDVPACAERFEAEKLLPGLTPSAPPAKVAKVPVQQKGVGKFHSPSNKKKTKPGKLPRGASWVSEPCFGCHK